jgi:hypothetical protein
MLEERIEDGAFLRLVKTWLKAGVPDTDGQLLHPVTGTPRGGIISWVVANVYLHYGYNLIQYKAGCTLAGDTTGNTTGQNPIPGPLQDNGGSAITQALLPGSPANHAANPAAPGSGGNACEASDRRGGARPQGSRCAIGAVEIYFGLYLPLILRQPSMLQPPHESSLGTKSLCLSACQYSC